MKTTKSTLKCSDQSPPKSSSRGLPRSVELIKIGEAQERLGMTQGSFMTLRKHLGIATIGKMVNWPTVIKRIEESQNPN